MGLTCCHLHNDQYESSVRKNEEFPMKVEAINELSSTCSSLQEKDKETEQRGKCELSQTISKPENPIDDGQKQWQYDNANIQSNGQGRQGESYEKMDIADGSVNQEQGRRDQPNSTSSSLQEKDEEKEERGKCELSQMISKPKTDDGQKQRQGHEAKVLLRDQDKQGRLQETQDIAEKIVHQGQSSHDQPNSSCTEDTLPLIVKEERGVTSDTTMTDQPHDPIHESALGGKNLNESGNLQDESHDLQHTEPPISFPDKMTETFDAEVKKKEMDIRKRELIEERRNFERDLQVKNERIKQLEEEKNELLNRISSIASARMTYDNPNITDLSDQNRPIKISERYSELYDNQWTDAFDILQNKYKRLETEAIAILLHVLCVSFDVCKEARRQKENLLKALKEYIGADEDDQDVTILEVMTTLKGTKRNIKKMQKQFNENVRNKLDSNYKFKTEDIRPYMEECVAICSLMNIQEPPMELIGFVPPSDLGFDLSAFRAFTESGSKIKYMVWPALYLYQNGPILCKGVAQGMSDSSNEHIPTGTKDDENKRELLREVNRKEEDSKVEYMSDQVSRDRNVELEQKKYPEAFNGSPTLASTPLKSSSPQSRNKTEKSRTQYDKNGSSQHIDKTTKSTKNTSYNSTKTEQQIKGNNQEIVKSKPTPIYEHSTRL